MTPRFFAVRTDYSGRTCAVRCIGDVPERAERVERILYAAWPRAQFMVRAWSETAWRDAVDRCNDVSACHFGGDVPCDPPCTVCGAAWTRPGAVYPWRLVHAAGCPVGRA